MTLELVCRRCVQFVVMFNDSDNGDFFKFCRVLIC